MKMAEFLNLDTKQVQWLDASLEHPNLVKVPEGAEEFYLSNNFYDCHHFLKYESDKVYFRYISGDWVEWKGFRDRPEDAGYALIWQRNQLQEKINETLSVLNVNKAQLSVLLGREKSYVKRLLAKGRNVTENTKTAVIDQLEQLIRVQEYENTEEPAKDIIDHEVIIAKLDLQLHTTSKLLDQAIAEKNIWRLKLQDQRNLSWFLILVVVVMVFFWVCSVWGV